MSGEFNELVAHAKGAQTKLNLLYAEKMKLIAERNSLIKERDLRRPDGVRCMQSEVAEWSRKNFGDQDPVNPLLGIGEEVGELMHAVLKRRQGIRGDWSVHEANALDALGDIFIYMCDFASRNGYDLAKCIAGAWAQVSQRDWTENKEDGTDG
jgi:NTP pyrophosphatase (non-canonical NTP hydrolase)